MRVAIAQINSILGDFSANQKKILEFTKKALERKCSLVIFPEAALFGYHPFDLLEREKIVDLQLSYLKIIEKKIPKGITAIFGVVSKNHKKLGKPYFNSAAVVARGQKTKLFHKQLLPTEDVFDEARFIETGSTKNNFVKIYGKKILITICEDIWAWPDKTGRSHYLENPLLSLRQKVDLVINISASPFYPQKMEKRRQLLNQTARHFKAPMVYVNMVGAQDEIIFDGGSFAVDKSGKQILQCMKFEEDINVLDLEKMSGGFRQQELSKSEEIRQALVLGIRDFCTKTGLQKVHLGLSGGIDSAVVACLAVDALGPGRVTCIGMPGPFSDPQSLTLAKAMVKGLKTQWLEMPIEESFLHFRRYTEQLLAVSEFGIMQENLQARIRGIFLMAFSNAKNSLLLSTSNKSELATGYSTLYGDMCGGLAVIGDLTKEEVYNLAKLYNSTAEIIPQGIISRAPTAELRPNQKDQDSLPEYSVLDSAVVKIVEQCAPAKTKTEKWLLQKLMNTEFKRWQAMPILKVSRHSFGRGRRYPIAHRASENSR